MATVLLVDPDIEGTQALRHKLEESGVEVMAAGEARTGFELAGAHRPACIVLCVELSGSSGYALCNKLKRDPELCRLPLVLASSTATPATFEEHGRLRTRADGYLHKPYELKTTLSLLARFVPQLEAVASSLPGQAGAPAASAPKESSAPAPARSAEQRDELSPAARDFVENAVDLHASTQMLSLAELSGKGSAKANPAQLIGEALADLGHTEPPEPEPISAKLELPMEPTPPPPSAPAPIVAVHDEPLPPAGDAPSVDSSAAAQHFAAQMSAPWASGQAAPSAPSAPSEPSRVAADADLGAQQIDSASNAGDKEAIKRLEEQLRAAKARNEALADELAQAQEAARKLERDMAQLTQRHEKMHDVAQRTQRLGEELAALLNS